MSNSDLIISAVSFLNTRPFVIGINDFPFSRGVQVLQETPAICSERLRKGEADIGIMPVADLPFLEGFRQITAYGIGADGPVDSVLLVSNRRISELQAIVFDEQSKTSNQLMRILAEEYYQINCEFIHSKELHDNNENLIGKILIGDKALLQAKNYPYTYDLSEAWKDYTGLPFVFAVWVGSEKIDSAFELEFERALEEGLMRRNEVIDQYAHLFPQVNLHEYLFHRIQYQLSEAYQDSLNLFLDKLKVQSPINDLA